MWNIFGRYRGKKVLPSARQMNLIASILNHVTQGTGIAMETPQQPSTDAPWKIGIDVGWLNEFLDGRRVTANSIVGTDADGKLDALCSLLQTAPSSDMVLTVKQGGTSVTWEDISNHEHTTDDITDWDDATSDFLTDDDVGTTVAAYNHTHDEYAEVNHTHSITDFAATGCTATPQSPCFILSDSTNGVYHSNQAPSVATVRAICTAWTNNGNSFGTGTSNLTHSDITDWAAATSGFLTSSNLSGYVTSSDLTTALADYASAQTVSDLADIVDSINNAYLTSSDLTTALADYVSTSDFTTALADYVTTNDLGNYLEEGDFPNGFLNVCASGKSNNSVTVVTDVSWNGTQLCQTKRTLAFTNGIATTIGNVGNATAFTTAVTYNAS